ncbi:MAG: AAA family ATPase [Planctomycetes bacterium]|nr:AAA family ATPase [Planctomycetota bacterium]
MQEKTYQTREFAQVLGISKTHLLRLEAEGKVPPARRVKRGKVEHRYYTVDDIRVFREKLGLPPLLDRRRTQLFLSFKGGTGKSSISSAYAYGLAELGLSVLAVDLDPQSHMTKCLGVETDQSTLSLFEILIEGEDINKAILKTSMPNLDMIPGTLRLSIIESRLLNKDMREFLLKSAFESLQNQYNVIVIDALPTITLLNKNAVLASDDLIVPVLADYLSYDGLGLLFHELARMEKSFAVYPGQKPGGLFESICIFVNQYKKNEIMARENLQSLLAHYKEYLCETRIPYNSKIAQSTAMGMPVLQYDPACQGSKMIRRLINEVFGFERS